MALSTTYQKDCQHRDQHQQGTLQLQPKGLGELNEQKGLPTNNKLGMWRHAQQIAF